MKVQAVPGPSNAVDDHASFGDHLGRARDRGRARCSAENAAARMAPVGQQIERVAVDRGVGDLVLEARHRRPLRPVGRCIGDRSDEDARFLAHVGEQQQRMARALVDHHVGHLDALVLHPGVQPAFHQDRVRLRVGAQSVKARLAVEVALGRVDGARQLVVEKPASVGEPLRVGVLGVGDALGQLASVGHAENVQDRVLAAVLREAVNDVRTVGGCPPPVQRQVAGRAAEQRRVDQHAAGAAVLAHEQLEVVGARRALLVEEPAAGALHEQRRRRIARQQLDALQEPVATGDAVEQRARVLILTPEKRQPVRVLVVLHPAVGVAQGFPEIGVLDHRDPRHGRRRDGRGGGRAAARQPCREDTSGTGEQLATIDPAHHPSSSDRGARARPAASAPGAASARRGRRDHPRRAPAARCCHALRAR